MSPIHVLPLRTKWVILVVKMPYPILIKHSVRVIHPSVCWCMMIDGTKLFTISCIELTCFLEIFPASKVLYKTCCSLVTNKLYVEKNIASEFAYIKRDCVICLVNREFTVKLLNNLIIFNNTNVSNTLAFFYRKEDVFFRCLHAFHRVILTKKLLSKHKTCTCKEAYRQCYNLFYHCRFSISNSVFADKDTYYFYN